MRSRCGWASVLRQSAACSSASRGVNLGNFGVLAVAVIVVLLYSNISEGHDLSIRIFPVSRRATESCPPSQPPPDDSQMAGAGCHARGISSPEPRLWHGLCPQLSIRLRFLFTSSPDSSKRTRGG